MTGRPRSTCPGLVLAARPFKGTAIAMAVAIIPCAWRPAFLESASCGRRWQRAVWHAEHLRVEIMKPRLVSFKLCPFVQRVAIALNQKGIAYDIEYIELSNPPKWFLDLSPLKKVPLLQVEDRAIFDSTAINEYIEDAYPNKLHPRDLVSRAIHRSWIEQSNQCTWSAFHLSVKNTEEQFNTVLDDLFEQFDKLERAIEGLPFFDGTEFSLVDVSYAPLLQRLHFLSEIKPDVLDSRRHPKIVAWKDTLLGHEAVNNSCVPNLRTLYYELLWKRQGYISRFLDETKRNPGVQKSLY